MRGHAPAPSLVIPIRRLGAERGTATRRMVLAPNEPFGAIFSLDMLTSVGQLHHEAWTRLAEAHGLPPPKRAESACASEQPAATAILRVFRWSVTVPEARRLAEEYAMIERDVRYSLAIVTTFSSRRSHGVLSRAAASQDER